MTTMEVVMIDKFGSREVMKRKVIPKARSCSKLRTEIGRAFTRYILSPAYAGTPENCPATLRAEFLRVGKASC